MNKMVDKVAEAIEQTQMAYCERLEQEEGLVMPDATYVPTHVIARAAITAMRKPTEGMIGEAVEALDRIWSDLLPENYVPGETPDWDEGMRAEAVWQAMIDAALK